MMVLACNLSPGRLRQKDGEFEAPGYIVRLPPKIRNIISLTFLQDTFHN